MIMGILTFLAEWIAYIIYIAIVASGETAGFGICMFVVVVSFLLAIVGLFSSIASIKDRSVRGRAIAGTALCSVSIICGFIIGVYLIIFRAEMSSYYYYINIVNLMKKRA